MNSRPIHASHAVFDVESEIVKAGNVESPVNLASFQERVDRIVGKALDSKPRLRAVWGQSYQQTRMVSFGRHRLKYPFWRIQDGEELRDIGIPRFFIEELHEVSQLNAREAWEKARYSWIDGVRVDILGDIPLEGYYTELFMIAHHDELCCNGREVVKPSSGGYERCLGQYRPPTDTDLQRIRRMYQARERASNDERAPSPELVQKRGIDAIEQRDEQWRADIRERIDDFMKSHAWKFGEHDPTKLSHGRFHWVRQAGSHSKSGATQEEITQWNQAKSAIIADR